MKNSFIKLYLPDYVTLSILLTASFSLWALIEQTPALAIAGLYACMLLDALDGFIARHYQLERPLGRHLDSFMDVISYLLLPALIAYQIGFQGILGWLCLLIMIASGTLRLAYFNSHGMMTNKAGKPAYIGMPVFWSTFILSAYFLIAQASLPIANLLYGAGLLLFSWWMLQERPFFKFSSLTWLILLPSYGIVLFTWLHFLTIHFSVQLTAPDQFTVPDQFTAQETPFEHLTAHNLPQNPLAFPLSQVLMLYLPIICAGIVHMWVVKRSVLTPIAKPLSLRYFGANKTWRGIIIMPVTGFLIGGVMDLILFAVGANPATIHLPTSIDYSLFGLFGGLAYIVMELPNSYLKRRVGIPEGQLSEKHPTLFLLFDQFDSIFGITLVALLFGLPGSIVITLLLLAPLIHLVVKLGLYLVGLKSEPR